MNNSYLFDVRSPDKVKKDFEEGKKREEKYFDRVVSFTRQYPDVVGFMIVDYDNLGTNEFFYEDGQGRPYKPDYRVTMRTGEGALREYVVEVKTSARSIPPPSRDTVFCKKSQVDKLYRMDEKHSGLFFIDPDKFAFIRCEKLMVMVDMSMVSVKAEPTYGWKESYLIPKRMLNWIYF